MGIMWIALACAAISFTITTTSIFKKVREDFSKISPWWDELIHCPWCLGHYISILFVLWTGPETNVSFWIIDWIITLFASIGLMGLIHYVLLRTYEPVAKAAARRKLEKLNEEE